MLDGFPRTRPQAEALLDLLDQMRIPLDAALFLDVPFEVILERLGGLVNLSFIYGLERRVHPASGRTYHLTYNPPQQDGIDDETGDPLIIRDDDKPESIKKRLDVYNEKTLPLFDFFNEKGILYKIPSPNSDVGYERIKTIMDELNQ